MKYLTVEQVMMIHDAVEPKTSFIRDKGALESAVARPQMTAFGEEIYQNIFQKAAALMHSLVKNHCFENGNKRTALITTLAFLTINDYVIPQVKLGDIEEIVDFMDGVAIDSQDIESMAELFSSVSELVNDPFKFGDYDDETFHRLIKDVILWAYQDVVDELATR